MFWGVTLIPGQPCTKVLEKTVCLSMAALESRQNIGSGFTQVVIQSEGNEHLLCTLMSGVIFQQYMNVTLSEGEKVTLSVEGTGMVHLTGFTIQNSNNNQLAYDSKAVEGEYYNDHPDDDLTEEQFTVKMEDSRDLTGEWEDSPELVEDPVSSEAGYSEQHPHVIAITDSEPLECNQMESGWQKEPENSMIPPQSEFHESQAIPSMDVPEGGINQLHQVSPTQKLLSGIRDHNQVPPRRLLPTVDLRRSVALKVRACQGDNKNRRRSVAKPKAASAHRAEEEAIEARRRRWRLAKREQRKKMKERYGVALDQTYSQSNSDEFYSNAPGTSTVGLESQQGLSNEPGRDFYPTDIAPSTEGVDFKQEINNFGGTTALQN